MALTQVSTKGLKDGTILNADINASAAIDGTKISPSFTSDIILTNANPSISLLDSDANSDFKINVNGGIFSIKDQTNVDATRLAIDSSGNVGIGTSSPAFKLDVVGDIHSNAAITGQDFRSDAGTTLFLTSGLDWRFRTTGGTEHMRIDSSGHVRFGLSGDGFDSAWQDAQYGNTEVAIDGGGGYGVLHFRGDGSGSTNTRFSMGAGDDKFYMAYDDVDNRHNIVVTGTGLIGIGTTNPTSLLTLNHATSPFIRLNDSDTTKAGIGADGGLSYVFAQDNNPLVFTTSTGTAFTERMRIATDGLITSKGDIRVDRGVAGVDGILGQAYAGYFGLKHQDQTINSEYMILNNNSHTFISCTSGYNIYIRPSANSQVHETVFAHNVTQFKTNILMDGHALARNQHQWGHLEGSYDNVGNNSAASNPIYTIGSSYNPNQTDLNTAGNGMFGIGFSHGSASFLPTSANWGLYAAANGIAKILLDAGNGRLYFSSNVASTPRFISEATGDYGSMQISNGPKNGWSGYSIDGHSVFMSNGTTAVSNYIGIYDDNASQWAILYARTAWVRLYYNGGVKFETTNAGVYIHGTLTATSTKSFRISHPLSELSETKDLVHAAIEGPQMDLMYRGKVDLVNGTATVNIDTKSGMTEGTFDVLNRDVQCFTTNETGWTNVKGSVTGNKLTIVAEDNSCTDTISWMVIGERKDNDVVSSEVTDDNGNLIVEPDKQIISEDPKMDD